MSPWSAVIRVTGRVSRPSSIGEKGEWPWTAPESSFTLDLMAGSLGRTAPRFARVTKRRPLSARNGLKVAAVITGLHGGVLIGSPALGLALFDAPRTGEAAYWLRPAGVLFAVLTIVFWAAANWPSSMMQRPVLWSAAIVCVVLGVMGLLAVIDGTMNSLFGPVVGVELALTIWLGWLLAADGI